jgi:hypothetical protein
MFGSLVSQVSELDPDTQLDFAAGFQRWENSIASGLTAMQERGDLSAAAVPADLATSLVAALQGGLILTQAQRDPRPLEVALDAALKYVESLSGRSERP